MGKATRAKQLTDRARALIQARALTELEHVLRDHAHCARFIDDELLGADIAMAQDFYIAQMRKLLRTINTFSHKTGAP